MLLGSRGCKHRGKGISCGTAVVAPRMGCSARGAVKGAAVAVWLFQCIARFAEGFGLRVDAISYNI